jgi:putative endonuclease
MYYVYILKLNNGNFYSGFTDDLKRRIKEHSSRRVQTTSKNLPINLVWYGCFSNKEKALEFEKYLKSSSGFAFRNKRLLGKFLKLCIIVIALYI